MSLSFEGQRGLIVITVQALEYSNVLKISLASGVGSAWGRLSNLPDAA